VIIGTVFPFHTVIWQCY